jgi:serine phosphatase RsbU (regulator of sigma subunit)/CheY-like chemotaxis protein
MPGQTSVTVPEAPPGAVKGKPFEALKEHSSLMPRPSLLPGAPPVKLLLVDDQPNNLLALEAVLNTSDVSVIKARSGLEALRCLLNEDFALILMDVKMPQMDGFETAALIRQRKRCQHTPIIFLTAVETDDLQMFKGYSLGAVDYIRKPVIADVLRSKVAVFVDIFRKTLELKHQAELLRQIELREHQRQLCESKERWEAERLRTEIRIARHIQQRLFPAASLPLAGFEVAGASYPAEATGGDYFDYIPFQDGSVGIAIGDVSGHGFGPSLLMAEMRAYLRAFARTRTDVAEILALTNQALVSDVDGRFATLLLARLDACNQNFVHASAGHQTAYILDSAGNVKSLLKSTGIALGVMPDGEFSAAMPIHLEPGDVVFLLTDGILEAHGADQDLFGADRAVEIVRANRAKTAKEIVHILCTSAREFCSYRTQVDDMTAIIIKTGSSPGR